ncbi:MAG: YdcF family protein [Saprospiraceae bacterium]|nr:YdcF family protein [Saprospiraceae bacterium]
MKKLLLWSFIIGLLGILSILLCNWWVVASTRSQIYTIDEVPVQKVVLVLGTSKLIRGKYQNPYFNSRIETAAALYKKGKVKHFILSGDNGRKSYNEPEDMQNALLKAGIPESAITLDYAGFRTLDSVVRCSKIFGQDQFVIISQSFHTPRALFIANAYGLDATAVNTEEIWPGLLTKTDIREYLSRCKAVLDLYILRKQPKFLGKKEKVVIS